MTDHALLLSEPVNFAVVQLPQRNFPGVVVQSDTLQALRRSLERGLAAAKAGETTSAIDALEDGCRVLAEAQAHLEQVCAARDITLPYD